MTFTQDLVALLKAESAITAVLTGGIHELNDLGPAGITKTNYPNAFNGAILKPCAFVKSRTKHNVGGIHDEEAQVHSARQAIEIRLYQAAGTVQIEAAAVLIKAFLDDRNKAGRRFVPAGGRDERQTETITGATEKVLDYFTYGEE